VRARVPGSTAEQGIRDISYDEQTGDFLILLGRSTSTGNEPFQLCVWNGRDDVQLLDVTFHRSMKPEGVVAFSSDDERRLLVVDDRGGYAVFDYPERDQ
jgi:ABC-type phosphonate transport system ATPase subunit